MVFGKMSVGSELCRQGSRGLSSLSAGLKSGSHAISSPGGFSLENHDASLAAGNSDLSRSGDQLSDQFSRKGTLPDRDSRQFAGVEVGKDRVAVPTSEHKDIEVLSAQVQIRVVMRSGRSRRLEGVGKRQ